MKRNLILYFLLLILLNCEFTHASERSKPRGLPDFRGLIVSITSLNDFKRSDDFKKCKDNTLDDYKGLAYEYMCLNLSPHIEKMALVFSIENKNGGILKKITTVFKDEHDLNPGSQVVLAPLLAKLAIEKKQDPIKARVDQGSGYWPAYKKNQIACQTAPCEVEIHHHKNITSEVYSISNKAGLSILELIMWTPSLEDIEKSAARREEERRNNIKKAADDRENKINIKKAEGLGI